MSMPPPPPPPPLQAGGGGPTSPTGQPLASAGMRVLARFLDMIIAGLIAFVIYAIYWVVSKLWDLGKP